MTESRGRPARRCRSPQHLGLRLPEEPLCPPGALTRLLSSASGVPPQPWPPPPPLAALGCPCPRTNCFRKAMPRRPKRSRRGSRKRREIPSLLFFWFICCPLTSYDKLMFIKLKHSNLYHRFFSSGVYLAPPLSRIQLSLQITLDDHLIAGLEAVRVQSQ